MRMHSTQKIDRRGQGFALIAALLGITSTAGAQIGVVHVTPCGTQTFPTSTCTIPATGTGNTLVVGFVSASGGGGTIITGITDNAGNIYAEAGTALSTDTAGNAMADIWYAKNSVGGATTITVNTSPSGVSGGAVIWEISGADPDSPLDQTAVLNSQAAASSLAGAPVTITSASEMIISVANTQGTITGIASGNAFTSDSNLAGDGWAHFISTTLGTYSAQWTANPSGTYCSSTVSFKVASAGGGPCDLNHDGVVNVEDVQLAVDMDLGIVACPSNLDGGVCGSTLVQQVLNAALGGACTATLSHLVSLTWTASVSAGVTGYNVYRSTTSGGTYAQINSSLVTTTSFTDNNVSAGQTYYYVATAVNSSNQESGYSNQATATVPSP